MSPAVPRKAAVARKTAVAGKPAAARTKTPTVPATVRPPVPVRWQPAPDHHDYPAAASYLSLLLAGKQVRALVAALRTQDVSTAKAKDILRAAQLPLLPRDNAHVLADLAKVAAGTALSPCLMVRGNAVRGVPALIADGYHRVCASYYLDENTDIMLKIVDLT